MTIIYQSDVENNANKGTKIYVDIVETSFKAQFKNHNKDFNHEQHKRTHKIAKIYIVVKKMSRIRQSAVEKVYGRAKINFCPLSLAQKLHLIEYFNDNRLLNKRNEFISRCTHQVKLLVESVKRKQENNFRKCL